MPKVTRPTNQRVSIQTQAVHGHSPHSTSSRERPVMEPGFTSRCDQQLTCGSFSRGSLWSSHLQGAKKHNKKMKFLLSKGLEIL